MGQVHWDFVISDDHGSADQGLLLTGHSHGRNLCPHKLGYGAPTTMVIYPFKPYNWLTELINWNCTPKYVEMFAEFQSWPNPKADNVSIVRITFKEDINAFLAALSPWHAVATGHHLHAR